VLRETTGKIRSIKSRLKKGMETYRRPALSSNAESLNKAAVRTEMLPDWLNMDYSRKENLAEEENLHDLEQKRRELEEKLKKYSL
jgi:replication initiation and membrane attachment protein DnaB